jgi:hypothetical protein
MKKPFALLICHSLRVATFEHEAETYVPQEVLE